jgi:stage II sporulation protein R
MRKPSWYIMAAGLFLAILISNVSSFINDGRKLDELRGSVLRLHILANSDSDRDQKLKLMVRDKLLESDIFGDADSLSEAENIAEKKLGYIENLAEKTLHEHGCYKKVSAEIADVEFDERVYGDITMPSGTYRALRIKIGNAQGHNWWCVMYPPLCLPAACGNTSVQEQAEQDVTEDKLVEEESFDEKELDMLRKPRKYRVRFAIWDKIKEILDE